MKKRENIFTHEGLVTYEERCRLLNQRGLVVWFTGLSGAGKSTIAAQVEKRLILQGRPAYRLDGDNIRSGLNAGLGFSIEDRMENIRRVAEVAALFKEAGMVVLVCFISPLCEMRRMARERAGDGSFLEVYIKADLATCEARDPKGLYRKARAGQILDFTGITSPFEEPETPELIIDTSLIDVSEAADRIVDAVLKRIDLPGKLQA